MARLIGAKLLRGQLCPAPEKCSNLSISPPSQPVLAGEVRAATLGELLGLPCWFVGAGKAPAGYRGQCYRQSQPPERGGVAMARFGSAGRVVEFPREGGAPYEAIIRPWAERPKIQSDSGSVELSRPGVPGPASRWPGTRRRRR